MLTARAVDTAAHPDLPLFKFTQGWLSPQKRQSLRPDLRASQPHLAGKPPPEPKRHLSPTTHRPQDAMRDYRNSANTLTHAVKCLRDKPACARELPQFARPATQLEQEDPSHDTLTLQDSQYRTNQRIAATTRGSNPSRSETVIST